MSSESQTENAPKAEKTDAEDSGRTITFEDPEKLIDAVRKQVEYYFSKENLQSDAYLTSQMDANMSVPVAIVMKFAKMKALTQDEAVLRKALENSTVTLIDNRIKANIKAVGRSTIILREIAADTPESEVRDIFAFDGCKPIVSMRSDIGDTWFIVMDSEEDAKDTLLDLRLKKRTFRGQSVKGRLKTETVVRSFYPMQTAAAVSPMAFPGYPGPGGFIGGPVPVDPRAYFGAAQTQGVSPVATVPAAGASPVVDGQAGAGDAGEASAHSPTSQSAGRTGDRRPNGSGAAAYGQSAGQAAYPPASPAGGAVKGASTGAAAGARDGQNKGNGNNKTASAATATAAGGSGSRGGVAAGAGAGNGSGRDSSHGAAAGASRGNNKGAAAPGRNGAGGRASIEINSANFPPLQANIGSGSDEVPTPGYKGDYVKYSFDDIINIVREVKDVTLPGTIKPELHPLSMSEKPNFDLLKRQRTFSIDETREQLMQGRPVQREAVLAGGAGDYSSMMYGDGYAAIHGLEVKAPQAAGAASQQHHGSSNAHHGHGHGKPSSGNSGHGHHHGAAKTHHEDAAASTAGVPKKAATGSSWAAIAANKTPGYEPTPAAAAAATAAAAAAATSSGAAKGKAPVVGKDAAAAAVPGSPDRAKKANNAARGKPAAATTAPAGAAAATGGATTTAAAAATTASANGAAPTVAAASGDKDKKGGDDKDKDRRRGGGNDRRSGPSDAGKGKEGGNSNSSKPQPNKRGEKVGDDDQHSHSDSATAAATTTTAASEGGSSSGGSHRGPPSSWGGKPTFANVLKQKKEAEAAAAAAVSGGKKGAEGSTATATPATPAATAESSSATPAAAAAAAPSSDKHVEKAEKTEKNNSSRGGGGDRGRGREGGEGEKRETDAAKKAAMQGVWAKETLPPL